MIGVIASRSENDIAGEFFELFKTPWEFFREDRSYDVILTTGDDIPKTDTKLVIMYGAGQNRFDHKIALKVTSHRKNTVLECNGRSFPVYESIVTFSGHGRPLLRLKGSGEAAGVEISTAHNRILRIGFNLFKEIRFLLSAGQPPDHASFPTLDIHIDLLRSWIVSSGIPLIEVPPVPEGYNFTVCLTHDVDFAGIRRHRLDHTMLGFIYRALIFSCVDVIKKRKTCATLLRNWKSVLLLPLVYLGIVDDFWLLFDRYIEIEDGLASTFYMVPFKNRAGKDGSGAGQAHRRRAVRYDANDLRPHIQKLIAAGCEVGLHGIDAWRDPEKGRQEREHILHITGNPAAGLRMHWLFYDSHTPRVLDTAGFAYDSTVGYNEAVGYKAGTAQVYRPLTAETLFELPMHIQDTALFYPGQMNLSEAEAGELANTMIEKAETYGGALTINWHHRSIGPERCWDGFYIRLLESLKKRKAWFATGTQIVNWFKKRRSVSFDKADFNGNTLQVKLSAQEGNDLPGLVLRVHMPEKSDTKVKDWKRIDMPFNGELNTSISL